MTNKINQATLSKNEEDYLKAVFHLTIDSHIPEIGTNTLAEYLKVSPASANSMIKKLKAKALVKYERYGKLELTKEGREIATNLIRKHRLWETFLYKHLNFSWAEVHEVAEQLEHIRSVKLMAELDKFLGYPKFDPHGDVIPDAEGNYNVQEKKTLAEMSVGSTCKLASVKDGSVQFLQYLTELGFQLSKNIKVMEKREFDNSMTLDLEGKTINVSKKFSENVYVI
ncbi:MAG: metal-dependent transcriptional regulator [Luteibaculum sp.]